MRMPEKTMISLILMLCVASIALANPVRQLFEKGAQAYNAQEYKKAIQFFKEAIKIYPELAPAYNYLGLCYKSLNADFPTVVGFFEKAIEIDPQYILAYDNLAKIYYGINDYAKAEKYNLKALEINPDLLSSHLSLGWINLLGKSDAEEAIYHFEKVVAQNEISYAYFGLGLAYFLDKNNPEVLNVITILRNDGEESLAQHLERMVRENRYIAPDRPTAKTATQSKPSKKASQSASTPKASSMKVRLRKP